MSNTMKRVRLAMFQKKEPKFQQCVFVSILIIIVPVAAFSEMKYIMEDVTVNSIKRLRLRNPGR